MLLSPFMMRTGSQKSSGDGWKHCSGS